MREHAGCAEESESLLGVRKYSLKFWAKSDERSLFSNHPRAELTTLTEYIFIIPQPAKNKN